MVLHGIYESGIIQITEKDLPDIKADVEIIFKKDDISKPVKERKFSAVRLKTKDFKFNREETHER